MKPPDDLKEWSKNDLIRELRRLRAVMREHAEQPGDDPRERSIANPIIDVAGDPHAQGGALVDARSATLLDTMDVVLIDTKSDEPVSMLMSLAGRINYSDNRIEHTYLYGPDGAAALVSQIVGLAARASDAPPHGVRFASEFQRRLDERMRELP